MPCLWVFFELRTVKVKIRDALFKTLQLNW